MKKFIAMLLALVMALSLVACGGQSGDADNNDNSASGDKVVKIGIFEPTSGQNGAVLVAAVAAAGDQRQSCDQSQQQSNNLFHLVFLHKMFGSTTAVAQSMTSHLFYKISSMNARENVALNFQSYLIMLKGSSSPAASTCPHTAHKYTYTAFMP